MYALRPFCLLLVLLTLLRPNVAPASEPAKIKALIITGGHGFSERPFFKIFSDLPWLSYTAAAHAKTGGATAYERPDLLDYDVVVLYDMPKTITDAQKAKFLSLFDHGVGLFVLHHAIVAYQHWPEYENIIGGRYPEEDGKAGQVTDQVGYQHDIDIPVTVVNHEHPITAGLSNFTIHDEIYWGFRVSPDITPLLSTTHPKSGHPIAWTRTQGQSRIVYLQLGHGPSAYENPQYRELIARGLQWAARKH